MKRKGNLYEQMLSIDNILTAYKAARKGKGYQSGVKNFDKNFEQNIADIYRELVTNSYKISGYRTRTIYERKPRLIHILPFRDRVVQHLAMLFLEEIFVSTFTADTYSCIKGKGVHKFSFAIRKALKDESGTMFCLKMDVKKFYPSVKTCILKTIIRRKIKDPEMLEFLDGIIDSAEGLPIGNYLSQYLANFYLTYFDHWIKEQKQVKYYFRYCDDIIVLSGSKDYLRRVREGTIKYLKNRLELDIKGNHSIRPVTDKIFIDVAGYKHYRKYTHLRNTIKKAWARKVAKGISEESMSSYLGWAKHCNSINLIKIINSQHEQVLRLRPGAASKVHRAKNRHIRSAQYGNCSIRLENRPLKVSGQISTSVRYAGKNRWRGARCMDRF